MGQIIQYKDKSYMELNVYMLPTFGNTIPCIIKSEGKLYTTDSFNSRETHTSEQYREVGFETFNIYTTSNDNIKEGDLVLHNTHQITRAKHTSYTKSKKIVATSDKSLTPELLIPQSFIDKYIKLDILNKVLIEIKSVYQKTDCGKPGFPEDNDYNYVTVFKTNSKKEVTIEIIKNTRQLLIEHLESNHIEATTNRVNIIMDFVNSL